ncbi:rho-associated protein kinase 1-like isoform X2 [Diachasmimorpha longicaudata]|uniref:rho-associated protein kinase 1-like isoform X2 n=1 Tax=Diachasmimorpha longicaudata TaxID=58733 RepID=UPI0030B8D7EF
MGLRVKYEMKWCLWVCWWYQALSGASAFPVTSVDPSGFRTDSWEQRYAVGSLMIGVLMIICVFSCLCCRRERRATKGFQEFKDVSGVVNHTILSRRLSTVELEVPRSTSNNRVEFEPLPVDRFVPDVRQPGKPKPPSPSLFDREFSDNEDSQIPNREWFSPELHIPRERLKYLREIGRGWFGKVVEGTQTLNESRTQGIVVRILTEEATASEKAWFLGEALPYLKLRHRNLLELFGTCLETDPYLLLFESCPTGDLKAFLRSNRKSEALSTEKIPLRMTLDISSALEHMHQNGFAHTDLSARNCLVSPSLTIKLGDYGIGVEKYPEDYYVVGDRALPIRWSAPESLVCTDTTIETRAITPKANLWSFAILLYEIASWGERPYDTLGDEQVIEMILSLNFESHLKLEDLQNSKGFVEALKSCWKINPNDRVSLEEVIEALRGKDLVNFEERWETLRPNIRETRSSSLKELRATMDSDLWQGVPEEKPSTTPQARFRLGPDEPLKNPELRSQISQESGSETEEESWRGRVERGAYTEKVKQKSKSIADLMVLVHIDDDSEAEWSLGPQVAEKPRKKINSSGSVGDLPSVIADEFDEALRKLRDISSNNAEREPSNEEVIEVTIEPIPREHIRDFSSTPKASRAQGPPPTESTNTFVDVELWKDALEFELERKNTGFESINFEEIIESEKIEAVPDLLETFPSAPDTPQSRGEISVDNEDFSNGEDSTPNSRRKPGDPHDEEDERKHLSTPDDERSSDSGFRDKESCEEEENNVCMFNSGISHSTTEEEQLKILYELDTILDAEYCGSYEEERPSNTLRISHEDESTESISQPTERINGSLTDPVDSVITVDKEVDNCTNVRHEEPSGSNPSGSRVNEHDDHEGEDDDSSTMSLRSDNSYVSFNLDEEFVAAIRNELREKLPRAQLAVVESQELRDEEEPSVNSVQDTDTTSWGSNEEQESSGPGNIDIAIRYNIYGTPLSPILEERESAVTSESFASRDDSREASEASRLSLSEDVIVVDTRTNKVVLVEGNERKNPEEDRDTCGDISDDESMDCQANVGQKSQSQTKSRTSSGAPLPSPEEESKWQAQFPIPLQLQDDLMSTSFSTEHEWDSQDEYEEGGGEERAEVEDEENSSSSGEFVWKRYSEESCREDVTPTTHDVGKIEEEDEEEEEEEFTPSAWDATLAPHRSALRSPEKNLKSGEFCVFSCSQDELDQKKNVWFKKQRYHCVYEYPKETHSSDFPSPAATTWEPTTYADWEEMMDEPRLDVYPLDYDESNHLGDDEFFVSSGNRPFQFQAGDGKYVSQFFPGANLGLTSDDDATGPSDNHQVQLGELRHTRDKLKLNLPSNQENHSLVHLLNDTREMEESVDDESEESEVKIEKKENSSESSLSKDDQSFRSVLRSPEVSERRIVEDESADEMSELEASKTENPSHPKSSGRPLVMTTKEETDTKVDGEVGDNEESDQKKETPRRDESVTKPSIIEEIIETCSVIEKPGENDNPA